MKISIIIILVWFIQLATAEFDEVPIGHLKYFEKSKETCSVNEENCQVSL